MLSRDLYLYRESEDDLPFLISHNYRSPGLSSIPHPYFPYTKTPDLTTFREKVRLLLLG